MPKATASKEELWRWLGISVGGALVPFGILTLVFLLAAGHEPGLDKTFGHGELFIPASIMNVEAMWTWSHLTGWGRAVWYPLVLGGCGTAAAAGALCFGVTTTLQQVPANRQEVFPVTLTHLSHLVPLLSLSEFGQAFLFGTVGITLLMLTRDQEGN